jgi:hypothetical protein
VKTCRIFYFKINSPEAGSQSVAETLAPLIVDDMPGNIHLLSPTFQTQYRIQAVFRGEKEKCR